MIERSGRRRVGIVLVIVGVASVVQGCLSLPREEQKLVHTFLLSQEHSAIDLSNNGMRPAAGVLLVGVPQAQPGFDSPRMAYTQRPYEVQYYATNQWAETPTRMLTPLLVQTIERRAIARAVVPMPTAVRGDYRLEIDQLVLVQEFGAPPSRAHIGFRAQLIKLPEQLIVGSHSFAVREATASDDAYGGAVAANRAVATVLDELGAWIGGCLKGSAAACDK